MPSSSAVFRYLSKFHDEEEETKREPHRAFIPSGTEALDGLKRVNAEMVGFVQSHTRHTGATLDMDATLVETHKQEALYSYKKHKAYQPLSTYWAEADQIVHSEFRDGNVPAGYQQLRVLRESLRYIPSGVEEVMLRSDTAGYQRELLKYCAEGRDERFGVIEFAVGVDVTEEFKRAIGEVAEEEWYELRRSMGSCEVSTGQQWAEVCFVPNWIGHSKNNPEYRFIAIRERLHKPPLPGMESQLELSIPVMEMPDRGWYKVTGVVTNRRRLRKASGIPGDELIRWYRQRCGKGEGVHGVLKEDLAGGRLPSGQFGANAAWWAIAVLAFNLNLGAQAVGFGWGVGEQTLEGSALWDHHPRRTGGASCPDTDHPPRAGSSLIPPFCSEHAVGFWHWLTDRPDRSLTFPTTNHHSKATQPSRPVLAMPSRLAESSTSA